MSTVADRPDEDLVAAVVREYRLTPRPRCRPLTGGYANDVYLVEGEPSLVLHVQPPGTDLEGLRWEHRLVRELEQRLPEVPAPLAGRTGRTFVLHGSRAVWLTPLLPGSPAGAGDRVAVAEVLGRLHAVDVRMPPRPGRPRLRDLPIPSLRELPPTFDSWLPLIRQGRKELIQLVLSIASTRTLVTGLTHNDVFPGNVLVEGGRVTWLIDWEEADVDWLVWDLACSIWPFCSDGARLDRSAMGEFVDSYRAAGGRVPADEDDLIVPLIRAKRMLEVLRAPTDRDPRWDLQLENLRAYEALGRA